MKLEDTVLHLMN